MQLILRTFLNFFYADEFLSLIINMVCPFRPLQFHPSFFERPLNRKSAAVVRRSDEFAQNSGATVLGSDKIDAEGVLLFLEVRIVYLDLLQR